MKKTLSEDEFRALHHKISKADCTKQWAIIVEHKDFIDKIVLDNDVTYVEFNADSNDAGASYVSTKSYLGNGDGIIDLLEAFGIKAEHC